MDRDLRFCGLSKKKKERLDIMKHAMKSISQDLDLVQILKSLQELDKLKNLLLDENQLIMFNFTPKPLIKVDLRKKQPKKHAVWTRNTSNSIFSLRNKKNELEPVNE